MRGATPVSFTRGCWTSRSFANVVGSPRTAFRSQPGNRRYETRAPSRTGERPEAVPGSLRGFEPGTDSAPEVRRGHSPEPAGPFWTHLAAQRVLLCPQMMLQIYRELRQPGTEPNPTSESVVTAVSENLTSATGCQRALFLED